MSDLSGKIGTFESQVATQHDAIMDALGGIAAALGGAPTDTFSDLLTAINTTNDNLVLIRSDLNTKLLGIYNLLDVVNTNASLNAQRILTLMLQTSCPCDPDAPLLPLPIDVTPTPLENDVKCQRIQFWLDVYKAWAIKCGVYLNEHGNISSFAVYNLLKIQLLDSGIPASELDMMSTGTRDELSALLNTVGTPGDTNTAIFSSLTDATLMDALRQALYGADNASDGKSAFDAAVGAYGGTYPQILVAMFYSSWPNVMYSDAPVVDASAYDGEICAPEAECVTLASEAVTITGYGSRQAIVWPEPFSSSNADNIGNTYSANQVLLGNFQGWTVTQLTGGTIRMLYFPDSSSLYYQITVEPGHPGTIPIATHSLFLDDGGAFTMEFCPPA